MYETVKRKVKRVELEDFSFSYCEDFFKINENRSTVLVVYSEGVLRNILTYEDFTLVFTEAEFQKILLSVNNIIWGKGQLKEAFTYFPLYNALLLELNGEFGEFALRYTKENCAVKIEQALKKSGVKVLRIKLPKLSEIPERKKQALNSNCLWRHHRPLLSGDVELSEYIKKLTDIPIDDISFESLDNIVLGNGDRTVYLVGACIVMGWENPIGERLADIVYEKLAGRSLPYKVEAIPFSNNRFTNHFGILEKAIKQNDIVLIISTFKEGDVDLTKIYKNSDNDILFTDMPTHTAVSTNRMIADELVSIIEPESMNCLDEETSTVIYYGEPQFSMNTESDFFEYINKVKNMRVISDDSVIGSIVMNCNPFTKGHRFLAEYAASQVDQLYVFVVEEDESAIPFPDRLFLVYENLKDIKNIIVIPSGKFIISKETFSGYFEKEKSQTKKAGNGLDVYIFARYIAKGLNITKRFVGEEPSDAVTRKYNESLKCILPRYGIELVEIPRKTENGKIISATNVRRALVDGNLYNIRDVLPEITFKYCMENRDLISKRIRRINETKSIYEKVEDFFEFVKNNKTVLYISDFDGTKLYNSFPSKERERLIFCERRVGISKKEFYRRQNKKIISLDELLDKYADYKVIIMNTKSAVRILSDLLKEGVGIDRIILSPFSENIFKNEKEFLS